MSAACLSLQNGALLPGTISGPGAGERGWGRSWRPGEGVAGAARGSGPGACRLRPGLTSQLGLFSCRQFRCLRSKASNGPLPSSRPGRADRPGGAGAGLQPAEDGAE